MSYRYMRIVLFFDLPMVTNPEKRNYIKFRNYLLKNGFFMIQQSVYCKLALNGTVVNSVMKKFGRKQAGRRTYSDFDYY
ncbi:CRISPR-associated endoribonuclease cas2 [Fusobacterium necrophorum subsp. funduliforme 1_1_36S]|nr:CRISPR-associated endoribonuclease cas2 [Fusobacterium necrophorum subsp. funduliforme 1_1_36S]